MAAAEPSRVVPLIRRRCVCGRELPAATLSDRPRLTCSPPCIRRREHLCRMVRRRVEWLSAWYAEERQKTYDRAEVQKENPAAPHGAARGSREPARPDVEGGRAMNPFSWKHDPGPCPCDDFPHKTCVSEDYAARQAQMAAEAAAAGTSRRAVVVQPIVPATTVTVSGGTTVEAPASSTSFTTSSYRREVHGPAIGVVKKRGRR